MASFAAQFGDFPDCYTIIGGAACDILMTAEGLDFRATKDIDMILVLEDKFPGFAERFGAYIKAGGSLRRRIAERLYKASARYPTGQTKRLSLYRGPYVIGQTRRALAFHGV